MRGVFWSTRSGRVRSLVGHRPFYSSPIIFLSTSYPLSFHFKEGLKQGVTGGGSAGESSVAALIIENKGIRAAFSVKEPRERHLVTWGQRQLTRLDRSVTFISQSGGPCSFENLEEIVDALSRKVIVCKRVAQFQGVYVLPLNPSMCFPGPCPRPGAAG